MTRIFDLLLAATLTVSIFVALPLFALAGLYSLKFGDCIKFSNGTEIGYEAYIDFSGYYLTPEAVVRDSSGTIMAAEVWPLHVTEKATFGVSSPSFDNRDRSPKERFEEDFSFIWTQQTGLVRRGEQPKIYESLEKDLGDIYYGAPKNLNSNTLWFLSKLKDNKQFKSDNCSTSLFTW